MFKKSCWVKSFTQTLMGYACNLFQENEPQKTFFRKPYYEQN